MRLLAAAAGLATLFSAAPALAWGQFGHQTIAQIAYRNVRPQTRRRIDALIKASAALDVGPCTIRTLNDASTWPDCIRGYRASDGTQPFASTGPWHYQDVEICQAYNPQPACKDGNCVSEQIKRQAAILRNRTASTEDRARALSFLIHFVGDLHQPLHAGEKADKGGNDVHVSYGIYTSPRLNLHTVWDSTVAERAITTGPSLVRRYTPAERAGLAAGTVDDWGRQSWQVAHDVVYAGALGGDPCQPTPPHVDISETTIEAWVQPVRLQVERGGLRLAKELDAALR
jgi:hypothetical protein